MAFNITEELAALILMKRTTTGGDLYEEIRKVLHSLDIPIKKLDGLVTDGAPSIVGRSSGVSSLITNNVRYTTNRDMIICHCLKQEVCAKCLNTMNTVTVVSKHITFVRLKGINHCPFKDYLIDMEYEYRNAVVRSSGVELWPDA